jgi:P63C domain
MKLTENEKKAAKAFARLGGLKGGKARAEALTPEERSEIARVAAEKRWKKEATPSTKLPKEEYTGILKIGDKEIPCAVLDNGLRVLSSWGVSQAMGSRKKGANRPTEARHENTPQLPPFLAAANIKAFLSHELLNPLISPIQYKPKRGRMAWGYEAPLLPRICEVILDADKAEVLLPRQQYLVDTAELLIRAFAHVGIIALVDEATGYQADRDREELQKILAAYISRDLLPWARRFPHEFYQEMFRLNGWQYSPLTSKGPRGPRLAGKFTKQIVYDKLPPGVVDELSRKNPVVTNWRRRYRHHQFLTEDIGHPHLEKQVAVVTALMRVSENWREFERILEKAMPSYDKVTQGELPYVDVQEKTER